MKTKPTAVLPGLNDEADADRIHRHLLGGLDAGEFQQLEREMLASASLRQRFMRAVRLDGILRDHGLDLPQAVPVIPVWQRFGPLAMASAAVLVAAATFLLLPALRETSADGSAAYYAAVAELSGVATLGDARDCRWSDGQILPVASRLPQGLLELSAGVAVIKFDGGTRLALQGPALLELVGPRTARLHRGNATVRCEEGAYSFSLLTPTSTVVDLGTEFGVAVGDGGASEVHVLDGEVEIYDRVKEFEPGIRLLQVGQTLSLASDGIEKMSDGTTRSWIRDYSTPNDRAAAKTPPRLLARDPFPVDFEQPNRFALGTGWKGAWWQATKNKPDGLKFVPMAPLVKRDGTTGLAMRVPGGSEAQRLLQEPIDPAVMQNVYVGFSLYRVPQLRNPKNLLADVMLFLRCSKDPLSVLGMGLGPRNHWVVLEGGDLEVSEKAESGSGPYFVVAKIEFDPLRGNRISMLAYRNAEDIPAGEPERWDFVTRRKHAGKSVALDTVALRVRHEPVPVQFGELSIGNSWQAVVDPSSAE